MKQYLGNNCTVDILPFEKPKRTLVAEKLALAHDAENCDDAFYIGDLGDIIQKYRKWQSVLPRVKPFYAVKCNNNPTVLKVLAQLGTSFDCASKEEIEKVMKLGVKSSRIVFANPCKQVSFIRYAAKQHVSLMTFDNEAELHKIKATYPTARLLLRILPPSDYKVQCNLGIKFGCHPNSAYKLLHVAKQLDLNVMGISFHVGSGCEEAAAYHAAISESRTVFDMAVNLGFNMTMLDIGGGFPGQKSAAISFNEVSSVVNVALDEFFPDDCGVKIIAEPGRYFVASAFTLAVNVIAKRVVARDRTDKRAAGGEISLCGNDEPAFMYYINDGVYGSFNCLLYDHAHVTAHTLKDCDGEIEYTSSVWGPTCDGLDCIQQDGLLPQLMVGDWLYYEDMGAYTMCAASTFNGMPKPRVHYCALKTMWKWLYPDKPTPAPPCFCSVPMKTGGCTSCPHCTVTPTTMSAIDLLATAAGHSS